MNFRHRTFRGQTAARFRRVAAYVGLALCAGLGAACADGTDAFSFKLNAGGGYDSNVSVYQISSATGVGDDVATVGANVSYTTSDAASDKFTFNYDFSQSLHATLHSFDQDQNSIAVTAGRKFGDLNASATYDFSYVLLGGRPFLSLHLFTPGVLIPVGDMFFVRPSIVYLNTTFYTDHARDASHYQPEFQAFYFFDHAKAYALLDVDVQREATAGREFDFDAYEIKPSVNLPFSVFGHDGKVKLGYAWLNRDYANVTPSIGVTRHDRWSTYDAGASVSLTSRVTWKVDLSLIDRKSNLSSASYNETVVNTTVSVSL